MKQICNAMNLIQVFHSLISYTFTQKKKTTLKFRPNWCWNIKNISPLHNWLQLLGPFSCDPVWCRCTQFSIKRKTKIRNTARQAERQTNISYFRENKTIFFSPAHGYRLILLIRLILVFFLKKIGKKNHVFKQNYEKFF